jgi:hypothetical protein
MKTTFLKWTMGFAEALLICIVAFSQTKSSPQLNSTELADAAFNSNAKYLQVLMIERKPPPDTLEYDIPPQCWTEPIKALKPVKLYNHLGNVAIVLQIRDGAEEGIYISNPISSYMPFIGVNQDGFEFMRKQEGLNVICFKRNFRSNEKSK